MEEHDSIDLVSIYVIFMNNLKMMGRSVELYKLYIRRHTPVVVSRQMLFMYGHPGRKPSLQVPPAPFRRKGYVPIARPIPHTNAVRKI
jgi:hypothetical protein